MKSKKHKQVRVRCIKCKAPLTTETAVSVQEVIDTFGNLPGFSRKVRWFLGFPLTSATKVTVDMCPDCMETLIIGRSHTNEYKR